MGAVLLVHGGWLDRHCWDLFLPFLNEHGIEAHTVTMPGNGETGTSAFSASMARNARAICDKIRDIGAPMTVLGHSMGGYSISAAAQAAPELIEHLIYLTAWVPPKEGLSMYQMDKKYGDIITGPLVETATIWKPWSGVIDAKHDQAAKFLCQLASDEAREFLFSHAGPQPIRPGLSKVPWTDAGMGRIPKTYIECTKDVAIPLAGQRHFQKSAEFQNIVQIDPFC